MVKVLWPSNTFLAFARWGLNKFVRDKDVKTYFLISYFHFLSSSVRLLLRIKNIPPRRPAPPTNFSGPFTFLSTLLPATGREPGNEVVNFNTREFSRNDRTYKLSPRTSRLLNCPWVSEDGMELPPEKFNPD